MNIDIDKMQESLGPCPICGRTRWWLNDVPLAGFCWGTEDNEHTEVKIVLQGEFQPYEVDDDD